MKRKAASFTQSVAHYDSSNYAYDYDGRKDEQSSRIVQPNKHEVKPTYQKVAIEPQHERKANGLCGEIRRSILSPSQENKAELSWFVLMSDRGFKVSAGENSFRSRLAPGLVFRRASRAQSAID
jgi:hypothetical protein